MYLNHKPLPAKGLSVKLGQKWSIQNLNSLTWRLNPLHHNVSPMGQLGDGSQIYFFARFIMVDGFTYPPT